MRAGVSGPRSRGGATCRPGIAASEHGRRAPREDAAARGGGPPGGLQPGRRPAHDRAGARAPAAVRAQQHARGQLLLAGQAAVAGGRRPHGLDGERKEKKRKRNREYQRAWRQRKKALKKKVSKEEKEEEKRKRHRESQRAYYQRIKGLKGNDKNVEQLSQKKLDDLQMKRKKLDSNEDQENVVQCKASQNLENVQLEQNQFLTQQLRTYEESHERITPKVILHRITDIPVADVRRKWSHVRNSYSRHLRNEVSGARTGRGRAVSRWYLADELAFLRDHMATDVRPSYAAFGPSFLEEGGAEVDVKPFASPWLLPRAELKPDALNDDSSSSHAGFTPDDNCSYFQFFKGIYNDYQELPSKKQRLFKRQCLNLLHDLLDDEEVPMIPECIQTFSDGPYSDDPVNLSGAGSDEERERKPKISDLTILPS